MQSPQEALRRLDPPTGSARNDTDLTHDYAAATSMGVPPHALYEAGVAGALCDHETKDRLRASGGGYDWSALEPAVAPADPSEQGTDQVGKT